MNKVFYGDCRESMQQMISDGVKVQMCVTSPPYYGLRDYGTATWEGGDSECNHTYIKGGRDPEKSKLQVSSDHGMFAQYVGICKDCGATREDDQLGHEETPQKFVDVMVDVFRLVRELLHDDGVFWLNIGDSYAGHSNSASTAQTMNIGKSSEQAHVLNVEQSRTRDREMLISQGIKNKDLIGIPWMLAFALRNDGWYLRQDIIWSKPAPMPESVTDRCTKSHEYMFLLTKSSTYYYDAAAIAERSIYADTDRRALVPGGVLSQGKSASGQYATDKVAYRADGMRNKRSVWVINTSSFAGAHFAVFPKELIEPCILAGSRPNDIVLDPFFGSGTTGEVCETLGRQWVGCELNKEYEPLQKERTAQLGLVFV